MSPRGPTGCRPGVATAGRDPALGPRPRTGQRHQPDYRHAGTVPPGPASGGGFARHGSPRQRLRPAHGSAADLTVYGGGHGGPLERPLVGFHQWLRERDKETNVDFGP